jgi:hypothetical protein
MLRNERALQAKSFICRERRMVETSRSAHAWFRGPARLQLGKESVPFLKCGLDVPIF